ncbi:SusD/RagB family nutrient-binding outer membrane lipoprotein [Marivirga sp.]|uniref:SusD/RagB family nutrient-binding outer membrane lipoprotein n=1 Tax=Marivirga sp. TaxID=2018662 RepID=UPI003DA72AA1
MRIYKLVISFLVLILVMGCKDYEDFQVDPNNTTDANPGLLLTNIEISTFNSIDLNAAMACRYLVNVNLVNDFQYYNWDRAGFGFYNTLRQVQKMEEESENFDNANYLAIAKFFRAFVFEQITRQFGDIPFSQALQAEQDVITPAYDEQKQVYLGILALLEEANELLDVNESGITGDVVFEGDLLKWKKLINSYHLRVLMSLSIKENDPDLDLASRFNTIFSNPSEYPLMESNADNCRYTYSEETGNTYPFWRSASITTSYILEESFIEKLKEFNDPRLFVLADPDANSSGEDPLSFDSYTGFSGSAPINDNATRLGNGEGSPLDERYIEDPEAEENLALGYAELSFTLAEAAHRGWISGNPSEFYENGIRASLNFYGIDENSISNYLNQSTIGYQQGQGLEQIMTQKYLSMFLNSGWEPFYNNRRTGFPEFDVSGAGILNNGRVPKRWMYPISEINQNQENLEDAIQRQYPAGDNINGEMWSIHE